MTQRGDKQDREITNHGRRNLLGSLVMGAAAVSASVSTGPAAALERASREPTHQNILDHLDDII